jgi:hypothetical protein
MCGVLSAFVFFGYISVLNFDKADLYQSIVDKKIPFAQWPNLIIQSIEQKS